MKQLIAAITQRGPVTIPAEVRRLFGIAPGGQVVFVIEGNQVRLIAPRFTLETAYGSVTPLNRPEDFKELIREAMEEHTEKVIHEMQGQ